MRPLGYEPNELPTAPPRNIFLVFSICLEHANSLAGANIVEVWTFTKYVRIIIDVKFVPCIISKIHCYGIKTPLHKKDVRYYHKPDASMGSHHVHDGRKQR